MTGDGKPPRLSVIRGRALPWLLLLASFTGAGALVPHEFKRRHRMQTELSQIRGEAVELRHAYFRALADLDDARHELKKKQLLAEALEEKLAKMAEVDAAKSEQSEKEKAGTAGR